MSSGNVLYGLPPTADGFDAQIARLRRQLEAEAPDPEPVAKVAVVVTEDDERLAGELRRRAMEAFVRKDDRLANKLRELADLIAPLEK